MVLGMERDESPTDTRCTWRDWPAAMVFVGVVIWVAVAAGGGTPTWAVYALLAFGGVAWLIRRGAFSPRR